MRFATLLVVVLVAGAALAGCSGKKGGDSDEFHVDCPNGTELHSDDYPDVNTTAELLSKCPGGSGSQSSTTSPPRVNIKSTLVLDITNSTGGAANVTMLDGNLTFSVTGSTDADGVITGAAVSVQDSNTTRTRSLYNPTTKTLIPATIFFDTPGVVNVTVVIIDDYAGTNFTKTKVFVNTIERPSSWDPTSFVAENGLNDQTWPDKCQSPSRVSGSGQLVTDELTSATKSFSVEANASYVVVTRLTGSVKMVICTPPTPGPVTAISAPGNNRVVSDPGVAFVNSLGYFVRLVALTPAPSADDTISIEVEVHYEPRPATP